MILKNIRTIKFIRTIESFEALSMKLSEKY